MYPTLSCVQLVEYGLILQSHISSCVVPLVQQPANELAPTNQLVRKYGSPFTLILDMAKARSELIEVMAVKLRKESVSVYTIRSTPGRSFFGAINAGTRA